MEKRSEKEKKVNQLSDNDLQAITLMIEKLDQMKESSDITEDSVKTIEGLVSELFSLLGRHQLYLRRWITQGYILD